MARRTRSPTANTKASSRTTSLQQAFCKEEFCLAKHGTIAVAFLDDVTFVGTRQQIQQSLDTFQTAALGIGLHINPSKSRGFAVSSVEASVSVRGTEGPVTGGNTALD
jgi:hypothetical protein